VRRYFAVDFSPQSLGSVVRACLVSQLARRRHSQFTWDRRTDDRRTDDGRKRNVDAEQTTKHCCTRDPIHAEARLLMATLSDFIHLSRVCSQYTGLTASYTTTNGNALTSGYIVD